MIYVDSRAGSKDLAPLLSGRGLPVTLTRMDYGDVCFLGAGPEGEPVPVGIEVKQIRDVLQCICDGRFAGHQLPGLVNAYDQVYLLVVGLWRGNAKTGLLQYRAKRGTWQDLCVGTRKFMLRDLLTWLDTIEIKGGIRMARVLEWNEATIWLSSLYNWWQKGWESHHSHLAFHDGTRHGTPYQRERASRMVASMSDRALLSRPTFARMVAAQMPHVGWTRSEPLVKRYKSVEKMLLATPEELEEIEGIGPTIAQGIWDSLRSEK
jgi:ERCC4-type nuclease